MMSAETDTFKRREEIVREPMGFGFLNIFSKKEDLLRRAHWLDLNQQRGRQRLTHESVPVQHAKVTHGKRQET